MNTFFALKGSTLFHSYLLSLQLVLCRVGAVNTLPHSSLVQIIFYFWSFEIKECILIIRKYSSHMFGFMFRLILVFETTAMLNLHICSIPLASFARSYRVADAAFIAET